MVMFFTSVGFNASLKTLKKGGKQVGIFLLIAGGLCFSQNIVAVSYTHLRYLCLEKMYL